jgi:hypothetical protein
MDHQSGLNSLQMGCELAALRDRNGEDGARTYHEIEKESE